MDQAYLRPVLSGGDMIEGTTASATPPRPAFRAPLRLGREHAVLAGILLLAGFLEFFRLEREGFANLYYAAAARSMGTSWHDFYFVSFDSGGFVSVDKPPLGLWIQVANSKIFGFHGWSLLAPQAAAAVASVAVLYHLVARVFGRWAGLAAALVLAVTPVTVAASRNNTSDVVLVFVLLLAAWAVILATERSSVRLLLLGAALVGLGFNTKMMQAYLVVPALAALYLFGMKGGWVARVGHLFLAAAVMLVVSFSWAVTVELTPPESRPFVGSTQDNSVFELMWEHNGLARLLPGQGLFGRSNPRPAPQGSPVQPQPGAGDAPGPAVGPAAGTAPPDVGGPVPQAPQQPAPGPAGPAGGETGERGIFRLFNAQLAGQASWLLPMAGLGLLAAAANYRPRWPLGRAHQQLILWGMWLITNAAFFSVANLFHRYYLVMLAPAVAALCGAGLAALWQHHRAGGWRIVLLPIVLAASVIVEAYILDDYPAWRPRLMAALVVAGAAAGLLLTLPGLSRLLGRAVHPRLGLGLVVTGFLALLAAPTAWALVTVWDGQTSSGLPAAGPVAGARFGPPPSNQAQGQDPLVAYLTANRGAEDFLVATVSTQQASPLVLATGDAVMALGGFSGGDPVLSASDVATMTASGVVRFFLVQQVGTPGGPSPAGGPGAQAPGGGAGQQGDIVVWVNAHCTPMPPGEWRAAAATQPLAPGNIANPPAGAPPQTDNAPAPASQRVPQGAATTLFDCGYGARR